MSNPPFITALTDCFAFDFHAIPVDWVESATRIWSLEPTGRFLIVDVAVAVSKSPFAVRMVGWIPPSLLGKRDTVTSTPYAVMLPKALNETDVLDAAIEIMSVLASVMPSVRVSVAAAGSDTS